MGVGVGSSPPGEQQTVAFLCVCVCVCVCGRSVAIPSPGSLGQNVPSEFFRLVSETSKRSWAETPKLGWGRNVEDFLHCLSLLR